MLPRGFHAQDCTDLIIRWCNILRTWTARGQFSKMHRRFYEELPVLMDSPVRNLGPRILKSHRSDAEKEQKKRLDVKAMSAHHREHGDETSFFQKSVQHTFQC